MNFQNILSNLMSWFFPGGIRVILVLLVAVLAIRFSKTFIRRTIKRVIKGSDGKRSDTLIGVFAGTLRYVIWVAALLMILPEFGINTAPILAGAGLIGLAVGVASKDIISDFISGLFIILEGQYYVGDQVKIAKVEGVVKEITLRKTIIKDKAGFYHLVPNSQVKTVSKKIN